MNQVDGNNEEKTTYRILRNSRLFSMLGMKSMLRMLILLGMLCMFRDVQLVWDALQMFSMFSRYVHL